MEYFPTPWGLSWWLRGKESICQAGDMDLIPELGRSPGEGNGNAFQYSCLGNPMDRGCVLQKAGSVAKSIEENSIFLEYI